MYNLFINLWLISIYIKRGGKKMNFMYTFREWLSKAKIFGVVLVIGMLFGIAVHQLIITPELEKPLKSELKQLTEKNNLLEKEIVNCLEIKLAKEQG